MPWTDIRTTRFIIDGVDPDAAPSGGPGEPAQQGNDANDPGLGVPDRQAAPTGEAKVQERYQTRSTLMHLLPRNHQPHFPLTCSSTRRMALKSTLPGTQ
eukprot:227891-Amphidinium_carterae.1